MGKNVKGFSIGDRCVADVGITVSPFLCTATQELNCLIPCSFLDLPIDDAINSRFDSVIPVSTAVVDNPFFARISMLAELPRMEDLQSLSNSKVLPGPYASIV